MRNMNTTNLTAFIINISKKFNYVITILFYLYPRNRINFINVYSFILRMFITGIRF